MHYKYYVQKYIFDITKYIAKMFAGDYFENFKIILDGTAGLGKTTFIEKDWPKIDIIGEGISEDIIPYLNTSYGASLWTLRKYNTFATSNWKIADRAPWDSALFQIIHEMGHYSKMNLVDIAEKIRMVADEANYLLRKTRARLLIFLAANPIFTEGVIIKRGKFDSSFININGYINNQNTVFEMFYDMLKYRGCPVSKQYVSEFIDRKKAIEKIEKLTSLQFSSIIEEI